jgi:hypothetical protein
LPIGSILRRCFQAKIAKNAVWKYADALVKVHGMLMATFDELKITPKMRSKIVQEIVQDDEITAKLKSLTGAK